MTEVNRAVAPPIHPIQRVALPAPNQTYLSNRIPMYSFNLVDLDLVKIEVVFASGTAHQSVNLAANFSAKMLSLGTTSKSAREIAEQIDFYGAFFEQSVGLDFTSFTIYSLKRYVNDVLAVFSDMLINPSFPKDEFEIMVRNERQKFLVSSDKVSVLCRRSFAKKLYSPGYAYYSNISQEDFDAELLSAVDYYNSNFCLSNAQIFVSGKVDQEVIDCVDAHLGSKKTEPFDRPVIPIVEYCEPGKEKVVKQGAIQSAIRIGKILPFNMESEDYIPFSVLNTVLGGYFSSRLMANIREDKGYTYGVGSGLVRNLAATVFLVATEVNAGATENTLKEIRKEIDLLRTEKVSEMELNRVKNYMVGSFLRSSDGAFDVCDRFKATHLYGVDFNYYKKYLERLASVTSQEVMEMAHKHLNPETFLEVVAGPE